MIPGSLSTFPDYFKSLEKKLLTLQNTVADLSSLPEPYQPLQSQALSLLAGVSEIAETLRKLDVAMQKAQKGLISIHYSASPEARSQRRELQKVRKELMALWRLVRECWEVGDA
ncbi:hypothetical protein RUND412_009154, partial [Rhizina undulata]